MTTADYESRVSAPCVTVRPYTRDDVVRQRLWPPFADPLLESYNLRIREDSVDEYFNRLTSRNDYMRFAVDDAAGDFVGTMSLRDMYPGCRSARLGIVL